MYHNGSFVHGINISRMTILVNIRNFIFTNMLASIIAKQLTHNYSQLYFHEMLLFCEVCENIVP